MDELSRRRDVTWMFSKKPIWALNVPSKKLKKGLKRREKVY
jgi:hypothetical protein